MTTPTNKFILQISGTNAVLESGTATEKLKNGQIAIETTSSSTTHLAYREVTASVPGSYDGNYNVIANMSDLSSLPGDNLGNHTATQTLNMNGQWISWNQYSGTGVLVSCAAVTLNQGSAVAQLNFVDTNITMTRYLNNLTINSSAASGSIYLSKNNGAVVTIDNSSKVTISSPGGSGPATIVASGNGISPSAYSEVSLTAFRTTINTTAGNVLTMSLTDVTFTQKTGSGLAYAYFDSSGTLQRGNAYP